MHDSARTKYGRRRRFKCTSTLCGHRWTEHEGERPVVTAPELSAEELAIAAVRETKLTEAQVRLILTRQDLTIRRLGDLVGRSRQVISMVRTGGSYATVAPELPRMDAGLAQRSCTGCKWWNAEAEFRPCRLGWPDPDTEGPGYARDCDDYERL